MSKLKSKCGKPTYLLRHSFDMIREILSGLRIGKWLKNPNLVFFFLSLPYIDFKNKLISYYYPHDFLSRISRYFSVFGFHWFPFSFSSEVGLLFISAVSLNLRVDTPDCVLISSCSLTGLLNSLNSISYVYLSWTPILSFFRWRSNN